MQPLVEELVDIVVVSGGTAENLCVTRPAKTFVSLRAVGRDIEEVAALTPDDVFVKAVDHRIGAGEPARTLDIGMNDNRLEVADVGLRRRVFGQTDIAEALEREDGIIPVFGIAVGDIGHTGLCRAVVFVVEVAVLVKNFGMVNGNALTDFTDGTEADITRDFLTEVDDTLTLGRDEVVDGGNFFNVRDDFTLLRDECFSLAVCDNRGLPFAVDDIGVIRLAVVVIGIKDRCLGIEPALIGRNGFGRTVGISDRQFRNDTRIAVVFKADALDCAEVPAPAEQDVDVVVLAEHVGDIVGLHLYAVFVRGPAGCKIEAADTLSVDARFIDTACGDGQLRLLNVTRRCK